MNNKPFKYDIEGLAKNMEVDLAIISDLYSEFFLEVRRNLLECRSLYDDKEWEKLERVIHNIKGVSISLCIDDLYAASNAFDYELKNDQYDNAKSQIDFIDNLFLTIENEIREFFKQKNIII